MPPKRSKSSAVSTSVRHAFQELLQRAQTSPAKVRSRWDEWLDEDAPSPTSTRELLSRGSGHLISVDDLLALSYCLDVSPASVLRLGWALERFPVVNIKRREAVAAARRMDDWLWSMAPLPGQDPVFFDKHRPVKLLVRDLGSDFLPSLVAEIQLHVESFVAAAAEGEVRQMTESRQQIDALLNRIQMTVKRSGRLQAGIDSWPR